MSTTRIKDHLSALVFDQIPEFAQVEYPLFAEFLKGYYSFLEQDQKAQEVLQNIQEYGDIDDTVEFLISKFFEQYGEGIPNEISADKRLFLKRLSDMYGAKGTEKGYRFLFNVLYNETIDFFYPQSEIIKASDGKWIRTFKLSVYNAGITSDAFKFENTRITGDRSGATAIVSHVIKYYENQYPVYELTIDPDSMTGNFASFEKIRASKLLRNDGSNYSFADVRVDLEDSEVYPYYSVRISELRSILLFGNASKQVAIRRLANLGVQYAWTDQQIVTLYNELFKESITTTLWLKLTPLVTHPVLLNRNTAYDYYIANPTDFNQVVTAFNAEEEIIFERILTIARDFNWTPEELVSVVNPALGRNYVAGDWRQSLLPFGPVYEEVTGFIYPMLAEIDVVTRGKGYLPGDVVNITSNTGQGAFAEVISVTPTGGIINVRVLESGVNYTTDTEVTAYKLPNNKVTARQLLRGNVASVIFDRDHGLTYGDSLTIASTTTPPATGSNVLQLTVCSAGKSASNQEWGVTVNGNLIHQGNATHTVSVYNTITMSFVEHVSYDLRDAADEPVYLSNVYHGVAQTPVFALMTIERNMANIGYSIDAIEQSNVIYVTASNPAIISVGSLPDHARVRVAAKIHCVDEWDAPDSASIEIPNDGPAHVSTIARPNNNQPPFTQPGPDATMTFVERQNYSRSTITGSIVMDVTKPETITLSGDCNIFARASVAGLGQQPTIIQPNVAVIGVVNADESLRTITMSTPFDLTGHTELIFETSMGGGTWGEVPETGEYLDLEYSIDNGQTWTQLLRIDPDNETPGSWKTHTVPLPPLLQNAGNSLLPILRFSSIGTPAAGAPRDTWAVTSIVTALSALTTNNGYIDYDSGWINHSSSRVEVFFVNTFDSTYRRMFVSNVEIQVTAEGSSAMAAKLNSLTNNEIVLIHTYDDASPDERFDNGLPAAMGRIGAQLFTQPMSQEAAYVCIGKVGFAVGEAIEKIGDKGDQNPLNQVCVDAKIDNGNIIGQSILVGSIPDDRTIKYEKVGPDAETNVDVYFDTEATLVANIDALVISDPFWKNNDGKLNENMFVQGRTRLAAETDPVYYQQFSYVIRSEHSITDWRRYAQDLMHPGGIALFGELKLQTVPADVIDLTPTVVAGVEIQDFFAITADKAQRTSPISPEFRADMTVFPAPSAFNPKKLTFGCPNFVYSGGKVPTEYVTVECMFVKERDQTAVPNPGEHILFSKYVSYEVSTKNNRLRYRVMRQGYQWVWVDAAVNIVPGTTYLIHLSYDGLAAKLYVNGKLRHQADNRQLSLALNGDAGILANPNRNYLILNGRNTDQNNPTSISQTCDNHSYLIFRVYDKALTDAEILGNYEHTRLLFNPDANSGINPVLP